MNFSKTVVIRLHELRMTRKKLSELTKISNGYLAHLINGERRWNEASINKVCEVLNLVIKFEEKVS
jgi:hypothetical protein